MIIMGYLMDHEQEKMWESIDTLASIDKEQAAVVFKLAIERSLREIDSFTPAISAIPLSLPDPETLLEMKKLDRSMRLASEERKIEKANEFLVDYINLLSQIAEKDSVQVQNQLISSILTKRSQRRALHSPKPVRLTKPPKKADSNSLFYSTSEAAKKMGLSDQTIRRMCEKGRFPKALKTDGGHWRIPKDSFVTTDEQDERANQILKKIDAKNQAAGYADEFDL